MFPCQFYFRFLKKSFRSDMSTFIPTNGSLSLPMGGTTCLLKQQNRGVTGKLASKNYVCNLIWEQKRQNQDAVKISRSKSNHFNKNLQIMFDTMVIQFLWSVFVICPIQQHVCCLAITVRNHAVLQLYLDSFRAGRGLSWILLRGLWVKVGVIRITSLYPHP